MDNKKHILALAIVGTVVSGLLIGCSNGKQKSASSDLDRVPVEVSKVKRVTLWDKVEFTGDIRGYYEAQIFPKVPGKLKLRVKDVGETVNSTNETIAMIDRDEPALEYAPAEVKPPFAGIITRYFASEGEMVSPAKPLAEIASIEKIKLVGQVSEKDISKIAVGQKVNFWVDGYPDVKFSGEVIRLSQVLDALSRTASVEVAADNPTIKLKPGMFARAEILVKPRYGALVVPRKAIIYSAEGDSTIFVVDENNIAQERKVRLGLETIDVVEILSGVKEGESVVTVGQYNLQNGSKVSVSTDKIKN